MSAFKTIQKASQWSAIAAILAIAPGLHAQTVTAYKTGEAVTGMSKQCYYNALGSQYTQTVGAASLCPLSVQVRTAPAQDPAANQAPPQHRGGTAFKTGENTTGMTKQCFYNYLGSQITRTLSATALCPLSINAGD